MKDLYKSGAINITEKVYETILECKRVNGAILVFLHKSVDGDCIGSATTVASVLRKLGVSAYVAMPEKLPSNMAFLDVDDLLFYPDEAFLENKTIEGKEVVRAFSVDCTEGHRMGSCGEIYDAYSDNLTIDHHEVTHLSTPYKWIEPYASSACELVYYFVQALSEKLNMNISELIDIRSAKCLLAGIVTDTGRFTYSNAKPETLTAAGELMELGGDIKEICYNLFDRKSKQEFMISNTACIQSEFFSEGKIAITLVTEEMFNKFNAGKDDIADVVSRMRDIDGVELSIVLRESGKNQVRGNLRSKTNFDCNKLASNFGGGGHKNASGFTIDDANIENVKEEVIRIASELL